MIIDNYPNDIARLLKVFRANYNLTQPELADKLFKHPSTIARWEQEGERLPPSVKHDIRIRLKVLETELNPSNG